MIDHLSLYKGLGSFLILSFTSSSVRCGVTRVTLPMIFSLSLTHDGLRKNHTTDGKVVLEHIRRLDEDFLIRAAQDRCVQVGGEAAEDDEEVTRLFELARSLPAQD